jgi:electron transfer flavoprotein alpha/beta subunit
MAAKKKEIREVQPSADAVSGAGEFQSVERIYLPLKQKQTQFLGDGDAKKGAAQLAEKLRTEARVI